MAEALAFLNSLLKVIGNVLILFSILVFGWLFLRERLDVFKAWFDKFLFLGFKSDRRYRDRWH